MPKEINILVQPNDLDNNVKEDIVIHKAGYYKQLSDHEIYRDNQDILDEFILIYCIDGEGWLKTPTHNCSITKGTFLFCNSNTIHAYGSNPNNPWTILWVHFKGDFANYFSKSIDSNQDCKTLELGCHTKLIQYMHEIISLLDIPSDNINRITANGYLRVCLCEILLHYNKKSLTASAVNEAISRVIIYMKTNLNSNFSLENFSNYAGFSKYYFTRHFKLITGFSPIVYFNRLKIQEACNLLITNTYNIQEISTLLGFSTPYYFSETFKQYTGFSPKKFRQLHQTKY